MLEGPAAVAALNACGVTHVIWIPDSELGTWEPALTGPEGLPLIHVCREGEAFAVAAGLLLGGKKPVVLIQCTGFFEAGDAFRNVVHDLKLPLFLVVGVRSWYAHQRGESRDSCPVFSEPILKAWQVPFVLLDSRHTADDLVSVALVKLLRHWRRVCQMEQPDAYVRRMLLRAWLDERRRPWRREHATAVLPDRAATTVDATDRIAVMAQLAELPPRRRAVLVLRYFCDLSVEQTADALGCSEGTVKSQTARAL